MLPDKVIAFTSISLFCILWSFGCSPNWAVTAEAQHCHSDSDDSCPVSTEPSVTKDDSLQEMANKWVNSFWSDGKDNKKEEVNDILKGMETGTRAQTRYRFISQNRLNSETVAGIQDMLIKKSGKAPSL